MRGPVTRCPACGVAGESLGQVETLDGTVVIEHTERAGGMETTRVCVGRRRDALTITRRLAEAGE